MSDPGGRHFIAEFFQCNSLLLNDLMLINRILIEAALQTGGKINGYIMHRGTPAGISGIILIDGSHLALHTFPQQNYASLDMYSSNHRLNLNEAYNYIANQLQASWSLVKELTPGYEETLERLPN